MHAKHSLHTSKVALSLFLCFLYAFVCLPSRSPLLGALSGAVAASIFPYSTLSVTLFPDQVAKKIDGTLRQVFSLPLVFTGFTCVYGIRGLRLIVMYNPGMRGRWVRILDERAMIKGLMATYVGVEVVLWSTMPLFGVNRWTMPILRLVVVAYRRGPDTKKRRIWADAQSLSFHVIQSGPFS